MSKVREGMTEATVRGRLGEPQDLETETDPDGSAGYHTWRYGTNGHLTCPTLGWVMFGEDGRVVDYGGEGDGEPPSAAIIDESTLRVALRVLYNGPTMAGSGYDPAACIRVVNALQPLGKERALAAMREYARVGGRRSDGLFIVLRVLFDVPNPPGNMPPMLVGGTMVAPPADDRSTPRYPVVIVKDVPFNLVYGYALGGFPQPVTEHIDYFRAHGRLRRSKLQPTSDLAGLAGAVMESPEVKHWIADPAYPKRPLGRGEVEELNRLSRSEVMRLARPVFRPTGFGSTVMGVYRNIELNWPATKAALARISARWKPTLGCYARPDGTTVADPDRGPFGRFVWRVRFDGAKRWVVVQRVDSADVDFEVLGLANGKTNETGVFRLATDRGEPVDVRGEIRFPDPRFQGGGYGVGVRLPSGRPVRVEVVTASGTSTSPVFVP